MNWLQRKLYKVKTGADIKIANDGKPIEQLVIKYKDFYFGIDIDVESGEPTGDFGWSNDAMMFPSTPVRHYLKVVPMYKREANMGSKG